MRSRTWLLLGALAGAGHIAPASAQAVGELKVVATIKPIHALAAAVMEGVGEPRLLIDGTGSPHTFTLKPSDAKALNDATIVLRVSEGLEPFTIKLATALPKSVRLVTLEAVPGLTLYPLRTGATFEADAHGAKEKGGHGHGHKHGKPGVATDGHIWLDPANAKLIGAHIAEVLAAVAPAHADRLRANAARLGERLDQLDRELAGALKPVAGKPYVVFHDAYQYLEKRHGLTPVGSVTVSPDVPPSAKRLTELRAKIAKLTATCVFAEPQFEPRIIASIVEGTTARRGTLDPLGAAIPAGPEQYVTLMRALAADLKSCLTEPA